MSEVATIQIPDAGARRSLFGAGDTPTRSVKLGARVRQAPMRVPSLSSYVGDPSAVPLPARVDCWSKASAALARMYLNDRYGCCVISGKHHQLGAWSGTDGAVPIEATDAEILSQYNKLKAGPGDSGCIITDVLDYFQRSGLEASGVVHLIDGYVSVDNRNKDLVKLAIYLFGSLTLGINLPSAWANGSVPGGTWAVTNSGSVGGHDVCVVGYNESGVQISTWGIVPPITITWDAFTSPRYITECYAQLAPAWYGSDKLAPCGVQTERLKSALELMKRGGVPEIDPPAPPKPVDPPGPVPDPVVMRGKTDPFVVVVPAQQLTFPAGVFGRQVTVTIPERRLPVSPINVTVSNAAHIGSDPVNVAVSNAAHAGLDGSAVAAAATAAGAEPTHLAVPWPMIMALLIKFGQKALPIILADLAAGKTLSEIVQHLVEQFLGK